jgi:hypothetical protein
VSHVPSTAIAHVLLCYRCRATRVCASLLSDSRYWQGTTHRAEFLYCGSLADDHPASAEPDGSAEGLSLNEILEELHETGGEGIVLIDSQGRRILGEGIVELMAGQLGRYVCLRARFGRLILPRRSLGVEASVPRRLMAFLCRLLPPASKVALPRHTYRSCRRLP